MKKTYEMWLEQKGYSYFTPEGRPSTIYDYLRGLRKVCRYEHLSIEGVAKRVDVLLPQYQQCGKKSSIGRTISRSVRSSLKQFANFVNEQRCA